VLKDKGRSEESEYRIQEVEAKIRQVRFI